MMQGRELTMNMSKLINSLNKEGGYAFTVGYLGAIIRNLRENIGITEEQEAKLNQLIIHRIRFSQEGIEQQKRLKRSSRIPSHKL